MAHSYHHAVSSSRRFGGEPDEYLELHSFMDSSKSAWGDQRHRAVLHHSFGIYLTEQLFGLREEVKLLRAILDRLPRWLLAVGRGGGGAGAPPPAEQHVIEDCGFIPTLPDYLGEMPRQKWMYRGASPISRMLEQNQPMPELVNPGVPTTHDLEPLAPINPS
jgi:hypothetical protein